MKTEDVKGMILKICSVLKENQERLCKLDSFIGDGDHGTTIYRGFNAVEEAVKKETFSCPAEILQITGKELSLKMGGAIGPLLGAFFQAGVKNIGNVSELGLKEFQIMFAEGLKKIQVLGGASEGDRTLVDALSSAVKVMNRALDEQKSLKDVFQEAKQAAEEGAENTKNLKAKKGRAKFLGEKSLGYVDAGAVTMAIIIGTMSDWVNA